MKSQQKLNRTRAQRKRRARSTIFGSATRPRLSIFKSNQHTYLQLIDDEKQETLASVSVGKEKTSSKDRTDLLSKEMAKKAKELHVTAMICDRGQYRYHGVVHSIIEGLKKEGITI